MPGRPVRKIPLDAELLAGRFARGVDYATARPSGTDDWLIIDTVAGGGLFGSAAGGFRTAPGDVVILLPGHPHDYRTDPAAGWWELAWAHVAVRDAWLDLLDWPEAVPGLLHLRVEGAAHAAITACLDAAEADARGAGPHRDRLAMNTIERALLLLAEANPQDPRGRRDPRLRAAMERALADLGGRHDVGSLARAAGLSPSRFAHRFRAEVGEPPQRWLERERMRRAAALLTATTRAVADIADEVGFSDPFYFSQRFRRWAGCSPRRWRQGTRPAP